LWPISRLLDGHRSFVRTDVLDPGRLEPVAAIRDQYPLDRAVGTQFDPPGDQCRLDVDVQRVLAGIRRAAL